MASPSHTMFSTPDIPGDETVVLVLLEGSGAMHSNWNDVRNYYLFQLLEALRSSQPNASVQIIWQLSADPYDQSAGTSTMRSTYSETHRQIPDFRFDPSASSPLSPATLRRSIEMLGANTPRDRPATRHLIVVAMSPPLATSAGASQPSVFSRPENWQSIVTLLYQDRVRLHMILHASSQLSGFREIFHNTITMQSRPEAPVWFQVNPRHTIHLSAQNTPFGSRAELSTHVSSNAPSRMPITPSTTTSSLPLSSPERDSPGSDQIASASSSPRRPRPKSKESPQGPPQTADASGPQLVNYIKQIHGLTKRRTPGGKTAKKTGTTDSPRASTSSRPILPRLELPPSSISPSMDPKGKATERAALEAASYGGSRYAPIAPALSPTKPTTSDEGHRVPAQPRRWPWLHPAPVTSSTAAEEPGLSPSAAAALRNLQTIAPRMPVMGTHLLGEQQSPPRSRRGTTVDTHTSQSGTGVSTSTSSHRQATYPLHGVPPPMRGAAMQGPQTAYHSSTDSQMSQGYATEQYGGYLPHPYSAYTDTTDGPVSSSPPTGSGPSSDDLENQPFVVTPEYEALANAEFEHAVRSGAMQASMTPTVMSPVAASPILHAGPGGYFPSDPVGSGAVMSPQMQQQSPIIPTPSQAQQSAGYMPYHTQHEPQLPHDTQYHQAQAAPGTGTVSSSPPPPGTMHYYTPNAPPGNDDPQARRWYG
ncbi:hypothetical protein BC835DRAFT_611654 [Cytidiella melzeri]|nr:hypothetical protein BC835DRAFT_611654 [Cytidiella melzeri]